MFSLSQIETDLTQAMKAKDQVAVDTLRGLKTRIQNEKISKMAELTENDFLALIRSEVKRRKESASAFTEGGRAEMAQKELQEAEILQKYLPAQMPEDQIAALADKLIQENGYGVKDFGAAMGKLKIQVGSMADGAILAKILKEKLK